MPCPYPTQVFILSVIASEAKQSPSLCDYFTSLQPVTPPKFLFCLSLRVKRSNRLVSAIASLRS